MENIFLILKIPFNLHNVSIFNFFQKHLRTIFLYNVLQKKLLTITLTVLGVSIFILQSNNIQVHGKIYANLKKTLIFTKYINYIEF